MAPLLLVVEDENDIAEALTELLSYEGYTYVRAGDGKAALEYLLSSAQKPSLILLDVMMPVMDGWQFLSELQKHPELLSIPIILTSAVARPHPNVVDFLTKPYDLEKLMSVVGRYAGPGGTDQRA